MKTLRSRLGCTLGILTLVMMATSGATSSTAAGSLEKEIIGKWTGGGETLQFMADGKFSGMMSADTLNGATPPRPATGTYFVDGEDVSLKLNGQTPMTCKAKITGDDMVITFVQGGTLKLDKSMAKYHRSK